MNCPVKDACTKNNRGRLIERTEHAPYIEQNQNNIDANPKLYKKRQAIVEHPYGILKWLPINIGRGFYYIMTKRGKKRASADVGLMFVAYNLRRIMNILDKNIFKKFLKELGFLFFRKLIDGNEKTFTKVIPIFEVPKLSLFLRAA